MIGSQLNVHVSEINVMSNYGLHLQNQKCKLRTTNTFSTTPNIKTYTKVPQDVNNIVTCVWLKKK